MAQLVKTLSRAEADMFDPMRTETIRKRLQGQEAAQ